MRGSFHPHLTLPSPLPPRERRGIGSAVCNLSCGLISNAGTSAAKHREQMAKFFVHILRPRHSVCDFGSQYLPIALFEPVDIRFKRAFGHAELTRQRVSKAAWATRDDPAPAVSTTLQCVVVNCRAVSVDSGDWLEDAIP